MSGDSGKQQRDGAAVRLFPPGVPLLTIVAGVLLNRWWPIDPGFTFPAPARYWVGGLLVAGAFLVLGVGPVVLFRRTGQDEKPWAPTPVIVDRGPFGVTRHPMYLQMVLGCVGFAIILMNVWILILTPVCRWVLRRFAIQPEEEYLERKFGETYLTYERRVRRWL